MNLMSRLTGKLPDTPNRFLMPLFLCSLVAEVCNSIGKTTDSSTNLQRIACCTPSDVRHLFNALFAGNHLISFDQGLKSDVPKTLPAVTSVKKQRKENFNIPFEVRRSKDASNLFQSSCKSYFNGTLHVIGLSTVHNVYHAGNIHLHTHSQENNAFPT
jgi:hypothetical protein